MKSATLLPTKKVAALLDEYGIQKTWLALLKTHAEDGEYKRGAREQILKAVEFKGVKRLEEDLLSELTVGEIGILYEFSLAYTDPKSRKESGQYFTPDDVAQWMASHALEFGKGIWLDPCSGVGNLSYPLIAQQGENAEKFLESSLVLADLDPLALLIARTIFTLHFYKTNDSLFDQIKDKFIVQNFLENPGEQGFPEAVAKHAPDYVIVNPPYAASKDEDMVWQTYKARDLYAYFMERIVLASKGYISVTPQSYTNSDKFSELRSLILDNMKQVKIFNFDNVPDSIFKGVKFGSTNSNTANSVRASIMIAKKKSAKDGKIVRAITPLLRWASASRDNIWAELPQKLNYDNLLRKEIFPKNYSGLSQMYDVVRTPDWTPLKDLVSKEETKFKLVIPSTPRYYITATKRELSRSSFHELYFPDKATMDKTYLYLNSSLLYWWWRVNDGGMTLSLDTLLSCPIENLMQVDKTVINSMVRKLEKSESVNLVSKANAGKNNENVKHPQELVEELNNILYRPRTAGKLQAVQRNSDFGHEPALRLFIEG
jgi:hypothetical protein